MSEIPALREALVGAAARRRRRRRALSVSVPAFAAVASALVLLAPGAPDPERAVEPAGETLARDFAVFARAQTADDRLPQATADSITGRPVNPALTRHVATTDGAKTYLLATNANELCVAILLGRTSVASCESAEHVTGGREPLGATTRAGMSVVVVPNRANDIRVTMADGHEVEVPRARGNVVVVERLLGIATVSWTAGPDTRRIVRTGAPTPRVSVLASCPDRLPPLPAGAEREARRAALWTAERVYRGVTAVSVTATQRVPRTACSPEHTIAVDLQLERDESTASGRLLLGTNSRGELYVYRVIR